jgi:hypothetical protein
MISTLTLTVASGPVRVPEPDPDHPDTQVWYTAEWEPHAWFYPVGADYWVRLNGIGTFQVAPNGAVLAIPEPDVPFSLVVDAYRRTVLPQALQFFGREILHASAVVANGSVVGFSAYSKTGKSTLAFALAQRGYEPWADDALAFETGPEGARTLTLPFAVRLRPESREHFGIDPLPPDDRPENGSVTVGATSLPLAAICILRRSNAENPSAPGVEPLPAGDVVSNLLPHAYWASMADGARKERMVRAYLALAGMIDVYRVTVPESLDDLPRLLDEIEERVLARIGAR